MTERTYYQNKPDTIKAGLALSKANPKLLNDMLKEKLKK